MGKQLKYMPVVVKPYSLGSEGKIINLGSYMYNVLVFDSFLPTRNSYIAHSIVEEMKYCDLVESAYLGDYKSSFNIIQDYNINIIIVVGGWGVDVPYIKKLISKVPYSILWTTEDPYELSNNLKLEPLFDYVFTNDLECVSSYGAHKAQYLPLAASEKYHFYDIIQKESDYLYDLCFVGTAWPNRVDIINELIQKLPKSIRFKVALSTNEHLPKFKLNDDSIIYNWRVSNPEFAKIVNRSKIVITIGRHFSSSTNSNSKNTTPPPRFFEQALAGSLQVLDRNDFSFKEYLSENSEVVAYENIDELVTKVTYFLDNSAKRLEIVERAQNKVKSDHLYRNRVDFILNNIDEKTARNKTVKDNINILFVTHNILGDRSGGGVEVYQDKIAKELKKKNYNILFLYPQSQNHFILINNEGWTKSFSVEQGRGSDELSNNLIERLFERILLESDIDMVHFQHLLGFPLSLPLIASSLGVKTVFTFHDYFSVCSEFNLLDNERKFCNISQEPLSYSKCEVCSIAFSREKHSQTRRRNFMYHAIKNVDAVIFNSNYTKEFFNKIYPAMAKTSRVIEMLTPEPIEPINEKDDRHSSCDTLKVVVPGNFTHQKGGHLLIKMFDALRNKDISFTILGRVDDGYREIINSLRLENVSIHGEYNQKEVYGLLKSYDVAVFFPIWPETYMISLNEAWAAGLVPIVSDIGAPAERVKDNINGCLVPVGNTHSLVDKINYFLSNRDYLGEIKKNVVATNLKKVDEHVQSLIELYSSILSKDNEQFSVSYNKALDYELDLNKLRVRVNSPSWLDNSISHDNPMGIQSFDYTDSDIGWYVLKKLPAEFINARSFKGGYLIHFDQKIIDGVNSEEIPSTFHREIRLSGWYHCYSETVSFKIKSAFLSFVSPENTFYVMSDLIYREDVVNYFSLQGSNAKLGFDIKSNSIPAGKYKLVLMLFSHKNECINHVVTEQVSCV